MKSSALGLLLVSAPPLWPQALPIPASAVTLRTQIYEDARAKIFLLDIPPAHATVLHRHDRDMLTIFVSGGRTRAIFNGAAPIEDTFAAGDVRFRSAGFTHSTENLDSTNFLAVILEFARPLGQRVALAGNPSRTGAAGGDTVCVDERPLLCTERLCADEGQDGCTGRRVRIDNGFNPRRGLGLHATRAGRGRRDDRPPEEARRRRIHPRRAFTPVDE